MAGYDTESAMRGLMMSPEEQLRDRQYDLQNPEMRRELEAEMSRGGNSIQRAALQDFHARMYGGGAAEEDDFVPDSQPVAQDDDFVPDGEVVAKRGVVPEVLRAIAGGAVTTLPKMINQAGQAFSPAGSDTEAFFKSNTDYWKEAEKGWTPDMVGHGRVARGFIEAGQQLAPSIAGMGAAIANPVAGAAAITSLYGGSQFTETYEKAREKGIDPDTAFQAAIRTGGIEGFGETIGDLMGAKFLKGGAKIIQSMFGKEGLSTALQMAKDPKWAARFGKDTAGNMAVQSGTEFGQGYGQAAVENEYGISNVDPMKQGLHGAEVAGYMSLLMGPFGVGGARRAGQQRGAAGAALDDTTTPIDVRKIALEQVSAEATAYGAKPAEVQDWKDAQQDRFIQDADAQTRGESSAAEPGMDRQFTRNPYEDERTTQAALAAEDANDDAQAPYLQAQEQRAETLRNNISKAAEQHEYAQLGEALDRHHEEQVLAQMDEVAKTEHLTGLRTAVDYHTEQADTRTADAASASTAVELLKSSLEAAKVELAKAEKPQFKAPKQVAQKAARVATRAAKVQQLTEQLAAATQAFEDSSAAIAHHNNMTTVLNKHLSSIGEAAAAKPAAPVGREVNATLQDVAQVQQQLDAMQRKASLIPKGMQVYGKQIEKLKTKLAGMYTGTEGAENASRKAVPAGNVQGQANGSVAVSTEQAGVSRTKRRKAAKNTGSRQETGNANVTEGAAQGKGNQSLGAEAKTADVASRAGAQKPLDPARVAALTRWFRHRAPKKSRAGVTIDEGRNTRDANVTATLGSTAVAALTKIHALADARDAIMAQFTSGRVYYRGKDGNLHRKTTGKGTGRTKETVYTSDREEVEANMQEVYSGKRKELEHISGELDKQFTILEAELGLRNIQRAQYQSKRKADGGVQEHDAHMFSSAFREWKAGNVTAEKPVGAPSSKDIRERKELGSLAVSKLASVYNDGFKFGGSYKGIIAVLQKLKFHGQNAFAANINGRLVAVFEDAAKENSDFVLPTMKFYSKEGLMVFNAKGVMTIDPTEQAPAPIAIWDAKTNTIHIGPEGHSSQVVVHEAVHAALAGYVQNNADKPVVKALEALRVHVLDQLKANPELMDLIGNDEQATAMVMAMSEKGVGIQEFLSYGLTHGGLQEAMRNMKMSGSRTVTGFVKDTWNAFVTMTRTILGLPAKYNAAFDQFLHVSGDILTTGYYEQYKGEGLADSVNGAGKRARFAMFDRLSQMWADVTQQGGKSMFRIGSDGSYGTPKRAYTLEQVLSHHIRGTEGWAVQPYSQTRLERTGDANLVRGWELTNNKGGSAHIFENKAGEVTFQSPSSTPGAEMWRGLQAALAYSFFNGKTFINEAEKFTMSDSAVARYTEAMQSAAIKFGSTDFMEPSRRQRDPQNVRETVTGEGKDGWISTKRGDQSTPEFRKQAEGLDLKGWWSADKKDTTVKERLEHNVGLMAKMTSGLEIAKNPELANIEYTATEDGLKFTRNGKVVTGLSTTDKRTVLNNFMAHASDEQFMTAKAGMAMEPQPELSGVFHARVTSAPAALPPTGQSVQPASMAPVMPKDHARVQSFMRVPFDAIGWDRGYAALANKGVALTTKIHREFPGAANFLSLLDHAFGLPADLRTAWKDTELKANPPSVRANELAHLIENMDAAEQQKVLDYLDGKPVTLDALTKSAADSFHKAFVKLTTEYLGAAKMSDKARNELLSRVDHASVSDMLLYVSDPKDTRGRSLSTAPIANFMNSRKESIHPDMVVSGGNTEGKFYAEVTRSADGSSTISGMIHESEVGAYAPSLGHTIDMRNGFFLKGPDASTPGFIVFSRGNTLAEAQKFNKAASHAMAIRNTVDHMDRVVSSARYATNTVEYGEPAGLVYSDRETLEQDHPHMVGGNIYTAGEAAEAPLSIKTQLRRSDQWIHVPDSATTYGDMAGKYVNGSVWAALGDIHHSEPFINSPTINAFMRYFKSAKTVWSPGTHVVNAGSNVVWMHLHDIPPVAVKDAFAIYWKAHNRPGAMTAKEKAIWTAFEDSGARIADYATAELKKDLSDAALQTLNTRTSSAFGIAKALAAYEQAKASKLGALAAKGGKYATKANELAQAVYSAEDNVFRLAAFSSSAATLEALHGRALTEAELLSAGRDAATEFLDYSIHARGVNMAKQSVIPFISWPYRAVPAMVKIAMEKPWKVASTVGVLALLDSVAIALTGGDDEDKRKRKVLPKYMNERLFGVGPHMYIQIPGMGSDNKPTYYRLGGWVPVGDMLQGGGRNNFMGQEWWPSPLTPNGPFVSAISGMVLGVDPFTGAAISKETDSQWDAFNKRAAFMWGQMMPPALDIKRGKDTWEKVVDGKRGPLGHEYDSTLEISKTLGLRFQQFNVAEAKASQAKAVSAIQREFKKEMSAITKESLRFPRVDRAALESRKKALMERMNKKLAAVRNEEE